MKNDASDSILFQHKKVLVKLHFKEQQSACLFLLFKIKSDNPYEAYFVSQTKGKGHFQQQDSLPGF